MLTSVLLPGYIFQSTSLLILYGSLKYITEHVHILSFHLRKILFFSNMQVGGGQR